VRQIHKVVRQFFPRLFEQVNCLEDKRLRRDYEVSELITACMAMFLFKETSRNAFNNDRREGHFKQNYFKVFKLRLPHMDTVEDFLRILQPEQLEAIKAALIAGLIEQKVLRHFRVLGKYYTVAIDGTGANSYTENDTEDSRTHKTSKNGKVIYHHYVVEAKLVTTTGLAISLASEWVTNEPERNFDKQDCEQRAFERLAEKLKRYFPRLPLCILADGLYPNKTFMQTCQNNGWSYVVVLKDDNLKILQQDITDTENKQFHSLENYNVEAKGRIHVKQRFEWIEDSPLYHGTHLVYWLRCTETITRYDKDKQRMGKQDNPTTFVWLTNLKVIRANVRELAQAGRNRWIIENEGFNTQKNGGYALGHKYSRKSFTSYKNYYQCMQIAHLINQLVEHSANIADMLVNHSKLTIKHLWKQLLSWFTCTSPDVNDLTFEIAKRCQIRLK